MSIPLASEKGSADFAGKGAEIQVNQILVFFPLVFRYKHRIAVLVTAFDTSVRLVKGFPMSKIGRFVFENLTATTVIAWRITGKDLARSAGSIVGMYPFMLLEKTPLSKFAFAEIAE